MEIVMGYLVVGLIIAMTSNIGTRRLRAGQKLGGKILIIVFWLPLFALKLFT